MVSPLPRRWPLLTLGRPRCSLCGAYLPIGRTSSTCRTCSTPVFTPNFSYLRRIPRPREHVARLSAEARLAAALARAGRVRTINVLNFRAAVRTPIARPNSRERLTHLAAILQPSRRAVLVCTRRVSMHSASCTRVTPARRVMGGNTAEPLPCPRRPLAPRHTAAHLAER